MTLLTGIDMINQLKCAAARRGSSSCSTPRSARRSKAVAPADLDRYADTGVRAFLAAYGHR